MANEENEHGFTDDEWNQLSDKEQEAIAGDMDDDDESEAVDDITDENEDAPADEDTSEAVSDDIAESDEDSPDDESPADDKPDEPDQPAADPREQHRAKIADADNEIDELEKQLDDGEIDFSEFRKLEKEITSRKLESQSEISKIDARMEAQQEFQNQRFKEAMDRFVEQPGHDVVMKSDIVADAMNKALRIVADSNEARGKSYDWLFDEAKKKLVASGFSFGDKAKPAADPAGGENKDKQRAARNKKTDIPQTLGDAPPAASNADNEFADLDSLSGLEFEKALNKLTPEQQDSYARG